MATINVLIILVLCSAFFTDAAILKPRIVGGKDASKNQFQYMVGIRADTTAFQWFICGGAIISDRFILSSATILKDYVQYPRRLTAILGTPNYGTHQIVDAADIEKVILHPDFDPADLLNDLAILQTIERMIFSKTIQPIDLPFTNAPDVSGLQAVVTGWGLLSTPENLAHAESTEKLQFQTTETLSFEDCVAEYMTASLEFDGWDELVSRLSDFKKFCTINTEGKGLCIGDRGSPLVANGKLIGIASWSVDCAYGLPDVYTNVYAHSNWIHSEMMKLE